MRVDALTVLPLPLQTIHNPGNRDFGAAWNQGTVFDNSE